MSKSITVGLGAVLAVLVLFSCSSGTDWAGEWRGRREIETPPGEDPSVAETLAVVKLKIKPSGGFELTEGGILMEGDSTLSASGGTLHIQKMFGRRVEALGDSAVKAAQERKITRRKDGTVLYENPGLPPLTMTRLPSEK